MQVTRRISQLLKLITSDKPGEVVAAASALVRTLASAGLDVHSLAETVETHLKIPTAAAPKQPAAMPYRRPDGSLLSIGDHILCDDLEGVFRPCGRCGSILFVVEVGSGPHFAQLVCSGCAARGRWLSRYRFRPADGGSFHDD
jgi:hypothetical protein